jgi:hypothetical protein
MQNAMMGLLARPSVVLQQVSWISLLAVVVLGFGSAVAATPIDKTGQFAVHRAALGTLSIANVRPRTLRLARINAASQRSARPTIGARAAPRGEPLTGDLRSPRKPELSSQFIVKFSSIGSVDAPSSTTTE